MLQALVTDVAGPKNLWYGQQIKRSWGSSGTGYWKATWSHEKRKEAALLSLRTTVAKMSCYDLERNKTLNQSDLLRQFVVIKQL